MCPLSALRFQLPVSVLPAPLLPAASVPFLPPLLFPDRCPLRPLPLVPDSDSPVSVPLVPLPDPDFLISRCLMHLLFFRSLFPAVQKYLLLPVYPPHIRGPIPAVSQQKLPLLQVHRKVPAISLFSPS